MTKPSRGRPPEVARGPRRSALRDAQPRINWDALDEFVQVHGGVTEGTGHPSADEEAPAGQELVLARP